MGTALSSGFSWVELIATGWNFVCPHVSRTIQDMLFLSNGREAKGLALSLKHISSTTYFTSAYIRQLKQIDDGAHYVGEQI